MSQASTPAVRRGRSVAWWILLWLSLLSLLSTQGFDAWQRAAPLLVWLFWLVPLLVLLPGLVRDRLRTVTWLAFVSLLYFVWAVLRLFAEPYSLRAQLELITVVLLFVSAMLYVRERGREVHHHAPPAHDDQPLEKE